MFELVGGSELRNAGQQLCFSSTCHGWKIVVRFDPVPNPNDPSDELYTAVSRFYQLTDRSGLAASELLLQFPDLVAGLVESVWGCADFYNNGRNPDTVSLICHSMGLGETEGVEVPCDCVHDDVARFFDAFGVLFELRFDGEEGTDVSCRKIGLKRRGNRRQDYAGTIEEVYRHANNPGKDWQFVDHRCRRG